MILSKTVTKWGGLSLLFFILIMFINPGYSQTSWYKYAGNPILEKGEPGAWDDQGILGLSVLFDGESYHMWYHGNDAFGYATSVDGKTWEKYAENPVMEIGGPGSWDESKLQMGHVILDGDTYKMWYDRKGNQGWGIGLATSPDGIHWTKDTLNSPVLTKGEQGSWDDFAVWSPHVIKENETYKMWYTGHQNRLDIGYYFIRIGYAESMDGLIWTKNPEPVLEYGDYVTWGYDLESPMVIHEGENFTMWYSTINGNSSCCNQIDYAISTDGIHWTRDSLNNPVMGPGENGSWFQAAWHPYVIEEDNLYKMWFMGSGGFGYAEDFSQFVHAADVWLNNSYVDAGSEFIHVMAEVRNPLNHELSAMAYILSDKKAISDSIEIVDDGLHDDGEANNGIYGGHWFPSQEKNYRIGIKTVDNETGFSRNGLDWNITDRFTSKGPIVMDSVLYFNPDGDDQANPDDRIKYYFKLLNQGLTDTIYNVSINVEHISGYTAKYAFGEPDFGDLPPGESVGGDDYYGISFSDSCPAPADIPFAVHIISESDTFWTDTFYVFVDIIDVVEDGQTGIPKKFSLGQNYPNPFNPSTTITYQLPVSSIVELSVYNLLGQKVATLVNEHQRAGHHLVKWDASNSSNGVYFYKIEAGDFQDVKKMIILK